MSLQATQTAQMRQANMLIDTATNMVIAEGHVTRVACKAHRRHAVVCVAFLVYVIC